MRLTEDNSRLNAKYGYGDQNLINTDKVAELEDLVTQLKISHSPENIADLEEAVTVLTEQLEGEERFRKQLEVKFREFLESDIRTFIESEAIATLTTYLRQKDEEIKEIKGMNRMERSELSREVERSQLVIRRERRVQKGVSRSDDEVQKVVMFYLNLFRSNSSIMKYCYARRIGTK